MQASCRSCALAITRTLPLKNGKRPFPFLLTRNRFFLMKPFPLIMTSHLKASVKSQANETLPKQPQK
jgi:hypothetical protein